MSAPTVDGSTATASSLTGPLRLSVVRVGVGGDLIILDAARHRWLVRAGETDGAPYAEVICAGRPVGTFGRFEYPRRSVFDAVARTAVVLLTGASRAVVEISAHATGDYHHGRSPVDVTSAPYASQRTARYRVVDVIPVDMYYQN